MTDLETRLRDALRQDTARRSADALLDDVRRGARRRRTRRMTLVAAAAAAVVVSATGIGVWHHQRVPAVGHGPVSHRVVGATSVSVDASGTVYKLVADEGCRQPCTTLWAQDGAGGWERRGSIYDDSRQARLYGPRLDLEMAPDGRDGWAWETHLWATHDGGRTWMRVESAPGTGDVSDLDLVPGPAYTWATRVASGGQQQLWRTPTGSDDWSRVAMPHFAAGGIGEVLPDSRVALAGADDDYYWVVSPDGSSQGFKVPCVKVDVPIPQHDQKSFLCGPGGRIEGGGELQGPEVPPGEQRFQDLVLDFGSVSFEAGNPIGHTMELHVTAEQSFLATAKGAVRVDLRMSSLDESHSAIAWWGRHVVILDANDHVYASDDNGRHWHQD